MQRTHRGVALDTVFDENGTRRGTKNHWRQTNGTEVSTRSEMNYTRIIGDKQMDDELKRKYRGEYRK